MALRPRYIEAPPAAAPARFGLLDTFRPQPMPDNGGLAGIEYDTEFCGVARPWTPPPCGPAPSLGSISVSVDTNSTAVITGTGEPAGSSYVTDWGVSGSATGPGTLDGQQYDYSGDGDGTYVVTVSGPDGYRATTTVTVTDGVATGPFTGTAYDTKVPDDGIDQTTGVPITIYHLFSCRLIAGVDLESRAARALDTGASRAIEQGFGDVLGDEATDVTPSGTAVGVVEGLALLEQEGGESYGGQRVIHADNAVVTLLISQALVVERNGHLETLLGSIVVSGPGYRNSTTVPSAPAAGAHWMYATGSVNVWADKTIKPPMVIDNESGVYDNEFRVLAERTFVPTFECFAVAVEVLLEA